jgi:hypothetical protein
MHARRDALYEHLSTATREQLVEFTVQELEKADEFKPFLDRVDRAVNSIRIDLVAMNGDYMLGHVEGDDAEGFDAVMHAYGITLERGEHLGPNGRKDLGKRLMGKLVRPKPARGPKINPTRDRMACRLIFILCRYTDRRPSRSPTSPRESAIDIIEDATIRSRTPYMSYEAILKAWRKRSDSYR